MLIPQQKYHKPKSYSYILLKFDEQNNSQIVSQINFFYEIEAGMYNDENVYYFITKFLYKKVKTNNLGGSSDKKILSLVLKSHSIKSKEDTQICSFSDFENYRALLFSGKVYVIGDKMEKKNFVVDVNSCIKSKISDRSLYKKLPSCVTYAGKVVVSVGINKHGSDERSVVMYDRCGDKWSAFMADMTQGRNSHVSVAIKNKLYIIGGSLNSCEVFDSLSNTFVKIKSVQKDFFTNLLNAKFHLICENVVLFSANGLKLCKQDTEKDELKNDSDFSLSSPETNNLKEAIQLKQ